MEINRLMVMSAMLQEMLDNTAEELKGAGYIHLYGTAQCAALIAKKRGLDDGLCELAQIAALLHDYHYYATGEREKHAGQSADDVLHLLARSGLYNACEMGVIATAIANHSDKASKGGDIDEAVKDADILQRVLYDPSAPISEAHRERYEKLRAELGI